MADCGPHGGEMSDLVTSDTIKSALLNYYRYERSMIVGTEVTMIHGIADILAYNDRNDYSVEVEVKISISDLYADFKHKNKKHLLIDNNNYDVVHFYYCVPQDIYDKAKDVIREHNKKYGIMVYIDQPCDKKIVVMDKPAKLCKSTNPVIPHCLYMRLSSEVAILRNKMLGSDNNKGCTSMSDFLEQIQEEK